MILKQEDSIIGIILRYNNLFIFDTGLKRDKTILVQGRDQFTYLLNFNPQFRL